METPTHAVAYIETASGEFWVYMTYSGEKEVFDKHKAGSRKNAVAFIHTAYPQSDIHTVFHL